MIAPRIVAESTSLDASLGPVEMVKWEQLAGEIYGSIDADKWASSVYL